MKPNYFIIWVLTMVTILLATVLACSWLAQRKHAPRRKLREMKRNAALWAAFWWDQIVEVPTWFTARIKWKRPMLRLMANVIDSFTPMTHEKVITKFTASAITTRYTLFKPLLTDTTQTQITICGAGDRALFCVADTVSTTDLGLANPAPVECIMLGTTHDSVPMIAAGVLNVGDIVYPAANGQVNTYVGLGSTGTNYSCGVVVANPALVAGDIVEVMSLFSQNSSTT